MVARRQNAPAEAGAQRATTLYVYGIAVIGRAVRLGPWSRAAEL